MAGYKWYLYLNPEWLGSVMGEKRKRDKELKGRQGELKHRTELSTLESLVLLTPSSPSGLS